MTRGRLWLVILGVLVVSLIGLGVWRRAQLIDEGDAARSGRRRAIASLHRAQRSVAKSTTAAGSLEADTAETLRSAQELGDIADSIAGQILTVQRERDDNLLNAWIAGGQVTSLRECLAGITRALNEVSVLDPHSTTALETVRVACRAAGA